MMNQTWGTVILSGGSGRRMGYTDKSGLICEGKTFLEVIGEQLTALGHPCYLSRAAYKGGNHEKGFTVIEDAVQGGNGEWIGPMGGIWSCFQRTSEDCLFFVSCDMPLFRDVMVKRLLAHRKPGVDAVLWRTRDGRIQPMCALYSRTCTDSLKQCIDTHNYRMMGFLEHLNYVIIEASAEHIPDSWFLNVNTPEVYRRLMGRKQPVLAVSGRKNTGKTWLLEMLVEQLSAAGIRAAVIKHDGHEFEADVPGTDSYRMKKAGAIGTVVYSSSQFSLVKDRPGLEAEDFLKCFPEADVILLEGQKYSSYPKIEVLRHVVSSEPVCCPETVLAYVSDGPVVQESQPEPAGTGCLVPAPTGIGCPVPIPTGTGCPVPIPTGTGCPGLRPVLSFENRDEITELVICFIDRQAQHPDKEY